ncbi:MAG: SGNH/GDSL hydrolase family protein [Bacteroidota bacterium]|nr:SGNH/GDSL hydrolase family protein [Bacteroidota bacterium]
MKIKTGIFFICVMQLQMGISQIKKEYKSYNPANDSMQVIEGKAWYRDVQDFYDRLPARAEQSVRKDLWALSKNSAGLQLRFRTDADEIVVKYITTGNKQMPHMPATGVSGIDLYSKNIDGKWLWAVGKYSFGDTVVYRFTNLLSGDKQVNNREYTLYFPLYNSVKWMEISVPKESLFLPLQVRSEKPIVVYGTSITQGACASRPGLAWTNILGRKLDRPVINLGFSGNGRLEPELINLMAEADAKLFVLDCLPNLTSPGYVSSGELKKRIANAISQLQNKKINVPILLTEHDGYSDEELNHVRRKEYQDANNSLKNVFDSLVLTGTKNIYLLSKTEINQNIESMVDGIHSNDIGMMHYAKAYEKIIKKIFSENEGTISTTIPVTQRRDAATYDWETRHNEVLKYNKIHSPELVLIGNSITNFWGGEPSSKNKHGLDSWEKYFGKRNTVNMGFGWDRIENVLWRINHGELDSITPKNIVLMIGTNNLQLNTDSEIVEGLKFLVNVILTKQPKSKILFMGILPRKGMEERVHYLNKQISKLKFNQQVRYVNAGKYFLNADKKINESLFADGLHPNAAGYEKLGAFIKKRIGN